MDFNTLLQTVIGGIVVPLVAELVKKLGNWNIPAVSLSIVCIMSILSAYGLGLYFTPDASMSEIIKQAVYIALAAVFVKAGDKSLTTSLIKDITGGSK